MNYTQYILKSDREIAEIKQTLGEDKFLKAYSNIERYITNTPSDGTWVNYLSGVPLSNISIVIKLICFYIDKNWNPNEIIEFNSNATMIRRKRTKQQEENYYAKYYKETKNTRSPFSR